MIIAIHNRPTSFSDNWIAYCREHNISYKPVDCYRNDIIDQLRGTDGLMWHWSHTDTKAVLFAKQLTASLETAGYPVFPGTTTVWHFDDKVGQKYLFEAVEAPLVPVHLCYDPIEARAWARNASFPVVLKLSSGASSINVRKIRTRREALAAIRRSFGRGIPLYSAGNLVRDRIQAFREQKTFAAFTALLSSPARIIVPPRIQRLAGRQKGYIYFQDFIPGLECDYRIVVVKEKAYSIKRSVRKGDFRASGSELKSYRPEDIPPAVLKTAFETAERLKLQCGAFDLVMDNGSAKIIEVSYAFASRTFPGYWDRALNWIAGSCSPQHEMVRTFIEHIRSEHAR